jgi:hypothetical protein
MISFPIELNGHATFENIHGLFLRGNNYVLENSPFYFFGVSLGDIVTVVERDRRLIFESVTERGRHSTYRIKLPLGADHEYFLEYWPPLDKLGCTYEGSSANQRRLYAIDLSPSVNVANVYEILEENEKAGVWEFEEGHYFNAAH